MKLFKSCIQNFVIVAVPFWCIATILMLADGMFDARIDVGSDCEKPVTRIELVLPGHVFGCWLSQPVGFN